MTGRFAPSPTGPLHAGSLVAALASWLDARARGNRWLVRIEDLDPPREVAGAGEVILAQLDRCGLRPDEAPLRQSTRGASYDAALLQLVAAGWVFPCGCSRREIADAPASGAGARLFLQPGRAEHVYPDACRDGLHGRPARALRLRVSTTLDGDASVRVEWHDRRLGRVVQDVTRQVGDFVLKRADGCWAYQLAVVVDDAAQGVTDVVRGEDLADSTARQIHLQRRLGLATPRYLHTPLVRGADGLKLSKQNGARALDLEAPIDALRDAGRVLGIAVDGTSIADWLSSAVRCWSERWCTAGAGIIANPVADPVTDPVDPVANDPRGVRSAGSRGAIFIDSTRKNP